MNINGFDLHIPLAPPLLAFYAYSHINILLFIMARRCNWLCIYNLVIYYASYAIFIIQPILQMTSMNIYFKAFRTFYENMQSKQ